MLEKKPKKALFLYTELAEYFLACIRELQKHDIEIHIVHWPINQEAPFEFESLHGVTVYSSSGYPHGKLKKLVQKISPDIIYCSGWLDKSYLKISRQWKVKVPVIVGFDNKWTGSLKQKLVNIFSDFTIKKYFTHAWVPGGMQRKFAQKMGFKDERILNGLYSCDFEKFSTMGEQSMENKQQLFPKKIIYVGRYYDFKGVNELWEAFAEIKEQSDNEWELWCLGTGDIKGREHQSIRHFGFVQPKEMVRFIKETGVFVLPSHREPWGVAVHEFAAAGFPLLCSNEVGANSAFLEEGVNGYGFEAKNKNSLKEAMIKIMEKSDSELLEMGEESKKKAKEITPEKWVAEFFRALN